MFCEEKACQNQDEACADRELHDFRDMRILPFSFPRVNRALMVTALLIPNSGVFAADWPNLRGPDQNGISIEADLRSEGTASILWKASVGLGYSTPVVEDGKVIVTGHDGKEQDTVYCFDETTGKEKWKFAYPQPLGDLYFQGGTTGSPTLHGNRVYLLARDGDVFSLDSDTGKLEWQKSLKTDFAYTRPTWGFSGAPLIWDKWLFLNAGDAGLCLDRNNGSVVWKSGDEEAGYSTPFPLERDGWRLVIFSNKRAYVCVDASNGTEVWRHKWMTRYGVNAADPIVSKNTIFLSTGYGKGAALLKWDGKGEPEKIWQNRELQTQMNAAVLIDGYLYGISGNEGQDGTGLRCIELATGTVKWVETSVGHGAVTGVKDKLLVLTEEGALQVAVASPAKYAPTFSGQVIEPKVWTVPVYANGRVYCRNAAGSLVVVDMKNTK